MKDFYSHKLIPPSVLILGLFLFFYLDLDSFTTWNNITTHYSEIKFFTEEFFFYSVFNFINLGPIFDQAFHITWFQNLKNSEHFISIEALTSYKKFLIDDRNVMEDRLALIRATQFILKNGLNLLGISAPNKM